LRLALYGPRYWPTWIGAGLLRLCELLPYAAMVRLGHALGWLARRVPNPLVGVVRANLALCLPERTHAEREALLDRHFEALGVTLMETAMNWWSPVERIASLATIEGREHLEAALAHGRGVIVLTAHFVTTEMSAQVVRTLGPLNALYRPFKNELLTELVQRRRSRQAAQIARDDIRSMVRALRRNEVVWYAPDQSYRHKGAEMVPFFGIPCATNTATSRIAEMTGATVLAYFCERLPDARGYRAVIHPPMADFPSGDSAADARRFHALIEAQVHRVPEQYWWVHRRFKGLPADYPDFYAPGADVTALAHSLQSAQSPATPGT
jgi:KDO2-lipid IV(A) lauroyltransferase